MTQGVGNILRADTQAIVIMCRTYGTNVDRQFLLSEQSCRRCRVVDSQEAAMRRVVVHCRHGHVNLIFLGMRILNIAQFQQLRQVPARLEVFWNELQ